MGILDTIILYFDYSFVRYAFIVGVLIAVCSSLFGATLILKRFSYIGDGLSHVAFGAMAVATVLNVTNQIPVVLVVTILCAIGLLRVGENTNIQGDAAIGILSVGSMAIGYVVLNLFSTSTNLAGDVCSTLFGATSILTLRQSDVWICMILAILVMAFFILFYHKIFAITFDENFVKTTGIKVENYNTFIAVIIAIIIVLAMNLVGSLLISALIIVPALSAMRIFKNFRAVIICSTIFSVICTMIGIISSLLLGTPVGATIVSIDIIGFLCFCLIGRIVLRKEI